jgi:hypothetical protein
MVFAHLRYAIYDLRADGCAEQVAVMHTPSPRFKGLIWSDHEAIYIAPKSGNIGYIVVGQALKGLGVSSF